MKKNILVFAFISILFFRTTLVNAQDEKMPVQNNSAIIKTHEDVAKKGTTNKFQSLGDINPSKIVHTGKRRPGHNNRQERENERLEKLREKMFRHKIKDSTIYKGNDGTDIGTGSRSVTPTIGRNFNAQPQTNSCPSDNSIAVSNGGYIVSASNEGIYFYSTDGMLLGSATYPDFFVGISLSGECDPRVIYDASADRFIFFLQSGSTNATTKVLICFSSTNNPMDVWHRYVFTDHQITGYWFDFPSVGISTNDFFVTGNLFDASAAFKDNYVYQIKKSVGYAGQNMGGNYVTYTGLSEGIGKAFTVVPCSYGLSGSYGPGIYMVSTEGSPTFLGSRDAIYVFTVSNSVGNSPQITRTDISTATFTGPADAVQSGSSLSLGSSVAGTRMQSAFYLGGYIHYTFAKDIGGTYSGIDYGRIDVANATLTNAIISGTNTDYTYPSVASFGTSVSDKSVVIAFLKSDGTTFPEIRYKYFDDAFNTVNSTLVKAGQSYIDYGFGGSSIRWGDYTGIQRRFNTTTTPACWLAGSYGATNHLYNTYIAEIKDANCLNPVSDFFASPVSGYAPLSVDFTNQSTSNNSYFRAWTFTGASPSSSSILSPSSIVYNSPGTYSVSLTNENACGSNTVTKNNYITVQQCNSVVASFNYTINGFTVDFINNSQNGTTYNWTFGDGNSSTNANPTYTFSGPGTYTVQLIANNFCGSNTSSQTITINTTELSELTINTLHVFPNPAKNVLIIDGEFSDRIIFEVYNSLGQLVLKKQAQRTMHQEIDISSISAGVYTIKTNDGIARFIKE